jgi:hypothetical protein
MRGENGYLKAREHLRRDFACRCAYCLIHENRAGGPEQFWIDHFWPRSKGGPLNDYANLYWSCMGCNGFKSDHWPTPAEAEGGYRYADPCREWDYGTHFAEDETGRLVAITNCGTYHIARLRLNRPSRLLARRERTEINRRLMTVRQLIAQIELRGPTVNEQQAISLISELIAILETQLATAISAFN